MDLSTRMRVLLHEQYPGGVKNKMTPEQVKKLHEDQDRLRERGRKYFKAKTMRPETWRIRITI